MNPIETFFSYFLFQFMYLLALYVFKIINKTEFNGRENLPRTTKVLFISNHLTFIDSLLIGLGLVSLKELLFNYRHIPWNAPDKKNFFTNIIGVLFMRLMKNIPIDRKSNGAKYIKSLINKYCKILKKGTLLIFPEGGRTKNVNGELMDECKPGVAMVILRMTMSDPDFKVVPIFISGMDKVMPREIGQKYLKIKSGKKIKMTIGKPVDFSKICNLDLSEKEKIKLIQKKVRDSIISLSPCLKK